MIWDEDPFERFFDDIDRMFYERPKRKRHNYREPVTDVWENDDYVFVTAELPGIKKDEIDLNVEENFVEIKAKSKNKKEDSRFYSEEFRTFYTKIDLPSSVDANKVEATFSNGILELKIPKLKGKKKKIEIKEK